MTRPFNRLLIANRGEIACRIARTAQRLGIQTIAVYSEADATARHVAACDEAIGIGGRTAAESYLRIDAIISAARQSGAQAVHPGYGFLSENANFADACERAGLIFVGPPAAAMRAMGSKSAAKTLMASAGVPLTPGYHGDDQQPQVLLAAADRIGYPVLIKASAGGGGRGMRRVDRREDFAAALVSCQRESVASFGDDRVLIEKYLLRPRHIEFQVFADSLGHCVHLFERDCSVQRRHQKVLEEAPAPGMTAERRAAMGHAAVMAANAVGYVGAGTVEFIVTQDGQFFFMEMNTRLQVEHPVTEMITGLDLVEWQLKVAAGEALPLTQDQVSISGHALEARLYAEDPDRGFLPSIGRLVHFSMPQPSRHVRIDAGVGQGDEITPYYDAMIGKLIVWDENRDAALQRMRQALTEFRLVGVANNVAFLGRLIATQSFTTVDLDTALIEREQATLFAPSAEPTRNVWLAAAAATLLRSESKPNRSDQATSPWLAIDGWRLGSRSERHLVLRAREGEKIIRVRYQAAGWELTFDGQSSSVVGTLSGTWRLSLRVDNASFEVTAFPTSAGEHVFLAAECHLIAHIDPLATSPNAPAGPAGLRSPMPGRVIELIATAGTEIKKGAPLLVLEAMKIEHTVVAPSNGTLRSFKVAAGEQVGEGVELVDFVPTES